MAERAPLHLYHYTDKVGFEAISRSQFLRAASGAFGVGQYFTDLPPTGVLSAANYSRAIFLLPSFAERAAYLFEIDTSGLKVVRQAGVYTGNRWSIFLHPSEFGLSIAAMLISSGQTVFGP